MGLLMFLPEDCSVSTWGLICFYMGTVLYLHADCSVSNWEFFIFLPGAGMMFPFLMGIGSVTGSASGSIGSDVLLNTSSCCLKKSPSVTLAGGELAWAEPSRFTYNYK